VLVFDQPVWLEGVNVSSGDVHLAYHSSRSGDGRTLTITWDDPESAGYRVSGVISVTDEQGDYGTAWVSYSLAAPQVALTSPTSPVTTSGTLGIYATVSGSPDKVEVLAGDGVHIQGVVLGKMTVSSGYGSFLWDTTPVVPGTYPVWLRATRAGWAVASDSVDVTVTK